MTKPAVGTLLLTLALCRDAVAEAPDAQHGGTGVEPEHATVVGGEDVALGQWPATAGVVIDGQVSCTGTLIAPNLVLTAAHCRDNALSRVIIGANKISRPSDGEIIKVIDQIAEPSGLDAALLVLERDAAATPHPLALGWAAADILDNAQVAIVGFGAINNNGNRYVDTLQQGITTITDPTCASRSEGCESEGRELIAGERGIDSCFGDSGGPLYLMTDYGTFLAGITSRGVNSGNAPCGYGGIYVRVDAMARWIEEEGQLTLPRPAAPSIPAFEAEADASTTVPLAINDLSSNAHTFEVATAPLHGTLGTRGNQLIYTPTDGYLGADEFSVTIVDANNPARKADVSATVNVVEASGGCNCQSGHAGDLSGTWLFCAMATLFMLRPRRLNIHE